jgi:hypothetical protein
MKRIRGTLIVIVLFPLLTFGQKGFLPGYIITNDFDTLKGLINLNSNYENSRSCSFIGGDDQNPKTFSPDDIKGYRIENSRFYLAKDIKIDSIQRRVFLEYLVDGIVDLYYLKEPLEEYYFIEKDARLITLSNEETIVKVMMEDAEKPYERTFIKNSDQYKRILTYLFQDSPALKERINNTSFAYKPLIKITKDYHNSVCDYGCIDFTKSTEQGLFIEPSAGMINAWMGLRIKTSDSFAHDLKPYYGLQLRIKPFKGYSRLNLLLGANYSSNSFQGDFNALYDDLFPIEYRIHTDYSLLRIPLGVDYSFTEGKLQPFISFVFNIIIILNPDYEVTRVDSGSKIETPFRTYQYGLSPGVGLKYIINKRFYLYQKNEFEYRIPSANFGWILDNHFVYSYLGSLGLGIKIK